MLKAGANEDTDDDLMEKVCEMKLGTRETCTTENGNWKWTGYPDIEQKIPTNRAVT